MTAATRSSVYAVVVMAAALVGCQSGSDDSAPSASESRSTTPAASAVASTPTTSTSASPSESATTSPTADDGASPSGEADGGEEVSVFDIEEGDCFSADGEQIESVVVVDCEQPHVYEAYHVYDHEADSDEYPGDEAMSEAADAGCRSPFEEFVDHEYETSIWYISWLTPSAETWAQDDREIVCAVNQQDDDEEPIEVTGSAQGAGE